MPVQFLLDRLFRPERLDRSMEEELRFHIAERAADLQRSGMPIGEAERRARLEFGGVENYKEQCRETRRFYGIHGFFADLRFSFRMLWRSPGFSILAILCLTLGIGVRLMRERYPATSKSHVYLDRVMKESLNLLAFIYRQIYFPTYSNGLKADRGLPVIQLARPRSDRRVFN